jgi:hypothetical protein
MDMDMETFLTQYKQAVNDTFGGWIRLITYTNEQKQLEDDLEFVQEQVERGIINQGQYMKYTANIGQSWQAHKRLIDTENGHLQNAIGRMRILTEIGRRRGLGKPDLHPIECERIQELEKTYNYIIS